jgi:hypothetical protein
VCERDGCFNIHRRPKIEEFAECLPGRLAFSDIDGITEVCGKFLLIEWKSSQAPLPTGQRIMFERMTCTGQFTVLVVHGNAETMEVVAVATVWLGRVLPWEPIALSGLKDLICQWAIWAKTNMERNT